MSMYLTQRKMTSSSYVVFCTKFFATTVVTVGITEPQLFCKFLASFQYLEIKFFY